MQLKGKTVAVTGGIGFIGSHLCDKLVELDVGKLIIIDNLLTGKREFINHLIKRSNVNFFNKSILDNNISNLLKDVDVVFHLAASNITFSIENPLIDLEINAGGTLKLLNIAKENGVKKFIYSSSASVYGVPKKFPQSESDAVQPSTPYGISKFAGERYAIAFNKIYDFDTVVLRYFNVYGPKQHYSYYGGVVSKFIFNLLKNKPPEIYGNGNQTRDFTFIKDCIGATILAATSNKTSGEVFNIATGKETCIKKLADILIKISGKNIKAISVPKREILDDVNRRVGDVGKIKKVLGFEAKTPLKEGLKITYDWFKNNLA